MAEVTKLARDLVERFKTAFLVVLAVVVVLGSNAYRSLSVYWSDGEIVLFFCFGPVLLLFLLFATVRAVSRRRGTPLPTVREAVNTIRNGRPPTPPFDWVKAMNDTYRPGRRIPALPVGINQSGNFAGVSMRGNESHLMTVGISGSGKSSLVNQMIVAAHNSSLYQIVVFSIKPGDFAPVENLKNLHLIKYDNSWDRYAADMPQVILSIDKEIQNRMARLSELRQPDIWKLRADQRPPLLLIVIEELPDLFVRLDAEGRQARKDFETKLRTCLNIGRAAGVHLFLTMQQPSPGMPADIARACVRLPFKVKNATEAFWVTGESETKAETLQALSEDKGVPPEVMIITPSNNQRVQIPWFTREDMDMLIRLSDQEDVTDFGEPTWLHGYTPQIRPVSAEDTAEGIFTAPTPIEAPTDESSYPRTEADMDSLVEHIQNLYDTNPEFKRLTNAFYLERGQLAALGGLAGMSQNSRMRGLFNRSTNGRYREFLNLIDGEVEEWKDRQAGGLDDREVD